LLLNKIFSAVITFTLIFLFSCGDSGEEKNKAPLKDYRDPAVQLNEAKKILGDNVEVTFIGNFNEDKK
jgi:ABC-type Zn uptake system ZnuABC Zn-binding protein ZnuA